jgi:molybdenum cofactor synthesis domain-containing protein
VLPAGTSTTRPDGSNDTRGTGRVYASPRGAALRALPRDSGLLYPAAVPRAGIVVIGNEILSGKVVDTNSPYLCRELRALGVDVERILTIPDDVDVIAREVRAMSDAHDFVFTSGGVGPTHDDLTMDGVARAFGVPLQIYDSIVERIERAQGKVVNESLAKMAALPAGAVLVDAGDFWFPVVVVRNVYVLPGIPELLRRKFESIRTRFQGVPFVLRRVYVRRRESDIAADLHALLGEFPQLLLGSYPRVEETDFLVLLTLESRDSLYVQRALDSLLARLPQDAVHKVE